MHSVCVTSAGEVYTFGNNAYGQCGQDPSLKVVPHPLIMYTLIHTQIVAVSCGAGHTICIDSIGRAYAWGIGRSGQLGLGSGATTVPFIHEPQVLTTNNIQYTSVTCGISHSLLCGFTVSGSTGRIVNALYGCGSNEFGQLGHPESTRSINIPTIIEIQGALGALSHVACGGGKYMYVGYSCFYS